MLWRDLQGQVLGGGDGGFWGRVRVAIYETQGFLTWGSQSLIYLTSHISFRPRIDFQRLVPAEVQCDYFAQFLG